jgi:pimeloyl-ACP methyl ester carboxylesterase
MSKNNGNMKWSALVALALGVLVAGAVGSTAVAKTPARSIVLVHGAFAEGSSWDRVVPLLQARGFKVVSVHEPMTSLAADVAATKRAISEQPGEVILVGHSYGGAVITEAGNDPKVVGLVYVAAFAPDSHESINDLGKGQPPPPWATQLQVDEGFARLPADTILKEFAQDLPPAEAALLAVKQGPIFAKCFDDKIQAAAWRTKRTWYVRTTSDRMIDPRAQAFMAQRMGATVTSVDASHVVMLSKPQQVAGVILDATARATIAIH